MKAAPSTVARDPRPNSRVLRLHRRTRSNARKRCFRGIGVFETHHHTINKQACRIALPGGGNTDADADAVICNAVRRCFVLLKLIYLSKPESWTLHVGGIPCRVETSLSLWRLPRWSKRFDTPLSRGDVTSEVRVFSSMLMEDEMM